MKLTLLVGNGFDIAMGLNTRYCDFVKFFAAEMNEYLHPGRPGVSEENRGYAMWLLQNVESNKEEFWSDAELAFGALPFSSGGENVAGVVRFAHNRFQACMKRWIQKEAERVSWKRVDLEDISSVFLINCITGWLPHSPSGFQNQYLRSGCVNEIDLNFVTYNYTDSIERLINTRRGSEFSFDHYNYRVAVKIGNVCHIHGLCVNASPANMLVFGVNDEEQIKDTAARDNLEIQARLSKQIYQKGYANTGVTREAENLIQNSDFICTYGLSFGATDKCWWELLRDYIMDGRKRLIVCPYTNNKDDIASAQDIIQYKQIIANKVFGSLGDESIRDVLKPSRISQLVDVKPGEVEMVNGGRAMCDYLQLESIGQELGLR